MKKILSIAALAVCFMTGAAHAATLDVTLGPSITYFYNSGQTFSSNLPLNPPPAPTPSYLTLVNNSQIVQSGVSSSGVYTSPTGLTSAGYLAVLGSPVTGNAIFTLAGGENQFGLTWGTIDTYNTLTINDAGHTFLIGGADILGHIPGPNPGNSQANVLFTDSFGNILTAQLTSNNINAFEAGDFAQSSSSATPLPASVVLFGSGLLGLLLIAYRRKLAKA